MKNLLKKVTVKKKFTVKGHITPNGQTYTFKTTGLTSPNAFVKQLRASHKASQLRLQDFALIVGSKTRTLQSWFAGDSLPSLEYIASMKKHALDACANHDRLANAFRM